MSELMESTRYFQEDNEKHSGMDCDTKSDYGSDRLSIFSDLSYCSSVSSAVRSNSSISEISNYRFEHNRRYHAYRNGNWMLPNDQQEQDRMDIVHQMMYLLLDNELYLSPLKNPRRILDIGTGTGIWAIEMAFKYPNARVIGNDLSPIQVSPPANCTFDVEDAESDWLYPTNNFDFIHARQLLGGIANWPRFFTQAYEHMRPGGWIEMQELPPAPFTDGTNPPADLPLFRALSMVREASSITGRNFSDGVYSFKDQMKDAGFVDIEETRVKIPLGPWHSDPTQKEIGRYNLLNFLEGIEAYTLALFTRVLGMPVEEVRDLLEKSKVDCRNKKLRIYFWLVVVRGRKPSVST